MEAWLACFIVLLLDLAFARETPVNTKYVIRKIDSCPDVGYYFKRDLSPNSVDPGPCYLCFCQNNGTAVCWEREQRRCDVEKYHHHRVGRQSRHRRSPIGLSDIFFRDASRDLFKLNSPEECKPFEASYSDGCPPVFNHKFEEVCKPFVSRFNDGCPPADWCIGCTVCDCDANGRWDCHILSFCDGKEKKKKIKAGRRSGSKKKVGRRNMIKKNPSKPNARTTTKRTKRNTKKSNQPQVKPQNKLRTSPKNNTKPTSKKRIPKKLPKKPLKKLLPTKKPLPKKQKQKQPTSNVANVKLVKKNETNTNISKAKIIRKNTSSPIAIQRTNMEKVINMNSNNETIKLGQKIVKQVMTAVQKLLMNEVNKKNATRVQRSALFDGKNCGRIKKMSKSTYNVKSNAAAKNKDKFKKLTSFIENYTNTRGRHKREILKDTQDNVTVIVLNQDINSVIPLQSKKNNNLTYTVLSDVTLAPIITLQQNYYKYSLKEDDKITPASSATTETTATEKNKSDSNFNLVLPLEINRNASQFSVENVYNKSIDVGDPEVNDLKFAKWFFVKINKDKEMNSVKKYSIKPSTQHENVNSTGQTDSNKKLQNYTIKPGVTKRQNTKKNVTTNYNIPFHYPIKSPILNKTDITGLQNVLQNLIKGLNKNNTIKAKPRPKVGIMKYVRKFFHKIFSKKKTRTDKVYGIGPKEDHTLQILCENIGRCNINKNNKFILKYKLKQLNEETANILKSIRIIKGLLHLLDLPYDISNLNYLKKSKSFRSDIQKLSMVLKDSYDIEGINVPLTETQHTQINYIKKNTQTFIDSVKKFADILNEIILITRIKTKSEETSNIKIKNDTVIFHKIKKLLKKYNIVQNTFIRKIYEMINGMEKKSSKLCTTTTAKNVGNWKEINDNIIESYSRNIIENLTRLKNLAQALGPKRRKRELYVKDSALEYLLTLMEYLIKQNHPLDTAPANDGIDFLIEAIKNAPDIKPIRKKVLDYSTKKRFNDTNLSELADSNSDSNRVSKEINNSKSNKVSNEENQNQQEDDKDVSRRIEEDNEDVDSVTPKVVYFKANNDQTLIEDYIETTSDYNLNKKRSNEPQNKTGFEKFESTIDESKKTDLYTGELEDEPNGDVTDNRDEVNITDVLIEVGTTTPTIINEEVNTTSELDKIATPASNESSSESQDSTGDKKRSKFDWIEATYDKEIQEYSELNVSQSSPKPTITTTAPIKTTTKFTDNISGVSAENDNIKEEIKKNHSDEVLYTKQMEFLNSLDYGTEKSDLDEVESNNDERPDDGSPSYFV